MDSRNDKTFIVLKGIFGFGNDIGAYASLILLQTMVINSRQSILKI